MSLIQWGLGLLGAISGLLAVVASQRIDPFYPLTVRLFPSTRKLYSARNLINEQDRILIRNDNQEELETVHEVFIDEYDFHEQYQPTRLRFKYNSFELEYADRRTQSKRQTSKEDVLELLDSRISTTIGQISAYAAAVSIVAFLFLTLASVV